MTNRQTNNGENKKIRTFPDLVQKEVVAGLILVIVVACISAIHDAPLGVPASSETIPAEHIKAPWIFVGIQLLLRYLPAFLAGIILPLSVILVITLVPFWPKARYLNRFLVFFSIILVCVFLILRGYFL